MKRVFGYVEVVFDFLYLLIAFFLGIYLLGTAHTQEGSTAGWMALILIGGDIFHLLPRIKVIIEGKEERYRKSLGVGKQITSITMTIFYLLLWKIVCILFPEIPKVWSGIMLALAGIRIFLCILPQNQWTNRYPPVVWGVIRNIPFLAMGMITATACFGVSAQKKLFLYMGIAIIASFAFYIPVVLFANKNSKIGMLMLPKTITYVSMLLLCLSL